MRLRTKSGCSGALGLFDERRECSRFTDRKLRQDLPIDNDPGLAEAVDKSAIGQAVLADGGIDALDPESAEGALLVLAVAIGVLRRTIDRGLGGADRILATAVEALGAL